MSIPVRMRATILHDYDVEPRVHRWSIATNSDGQKWLSLIMDRQPWHNAKGHRLRFCTLAHDLMCKYEYFSVYLGRGDGLYKYVFRVWR